MSIKVLRARKVHTLDHTGTDGTWVAIEDGRIHSVGSGEPPSGENYESEGVVLPGLIDCHVHLTTTGMYRSGLDLAACRSVGELLAATGNFIEGSSAEWIIGGNFDPGRNPDARMPTRHELDPIAGERVLVISRADGHSCAMTTAALKQLDVDGSLPGFDLDEAGEPTGILSNRANYEARRRFFAAIPSAEMAAAQIEACRGALERGVTCVHEMGGDDRREIDVYLTNRSRFPLHVRPYFATTDTVAVSEAGLDCIGGDWFLDGSIGSRTAAMSEPYEDDPSSGFLYHTDDEVTDFFVRSSKAGLQVGVHAIGDAAIEQAIRCMEEAFLLLGPDLAAKARGLRHRIEHFECSSLEQVRRTARLEMVASVQPTFDLYWGGAEGMYQKRLGKRAEAMNPFAAMVRESLTIAGGSDSTVTPLDPFLGMQAAAGHQTEDHKLNRDQAVRLFSEWAAWAGRDEKVRGSIEPGKRADFCIADRDPFEVHMDDLPRLAVLETWVGGEPAWRSI